MSAFDELQDQLLDSVARRAPRTGRSRLLRFPRWQRGRQRGGPLLIAIPLAFIAAAATAATIATRSGPSPGDQLLRQVLSLTHSGRPTGPCAVTGGRRVAKLSDEAPEGSITAILPALASASPRAPSRKLISVAEHNSGGAVLRRTIREVPMPDGIRLVVWVSHGEASFSTVDPKRCLATRLAMLVRLRPDPHDPLRQKVAHWIRGMRDTRGYGQALTLQDGLSGGGTTLPLTSKGEALHAGVDFSAAGCKYGRCSPVVYGGIAGTSTAYLTVAPAPHQGAKARRVRRRIAVAQGLFAFALPPDTGRETISERKRDGAVLATEQLPEPGLLVSHLEHKENVIKEGKAASDEGTASGASTARRKRR